MLEREPLNSENKNNRRVDRIAPKGSIRRGLVYLTFGLSGLYLVLNQTAHQLLDQGTAKISNQLDTKIGPATKDIDEFMEKADGFYEDYGKFRIDICLSPLGGAMDGCVDILEDYNKQKAKEESAAAVTTTTTIATTIPGQMPN